MRVCLVSPYDLTLPGGVQAQVRGLARWLRQTGDDVRLVAPAVTEKDQGVSVGKVTRIRANRSVAPISLAGGITQAMAPILEWAEVTHIHEPLMPRVGWAALRTPGPRVLTFHADPPRWTRAIYQMLGLLPGFLTKPGTVVTAVSKQAASALPASWGPERIIPNGVDDAPNLQLVSRRAKHVMFLGRDEPRKGLDVLLSAWPQITRTHPDARLTVMGADRTDPTDAVVYRGRVSEDEKHRGLQSAQVYVAPNLGGESFGIVLAEAMAAGCALVASDLKAFRDVAGPAAKYCPVGDAQTLAETVSEVLADPVLSRRLRQAGTERARWFSWERVGAAYRECYQQAMKVGP